VGLDFGRERERFRRSFGSGRFLLRTHAVFFDNAVTHGNAVATNLYACARNHLLDAFCGLAAKTTRNRRVIFPATIH
jgi:hypothetical protein